MTSDTAPAKHLVKCLVCGASVAAANLEKHSRKVHSAQAERSKQLTERGRVAAKYENLRLESVMSCPECTKKYMVRDMKSHFLNAHRKAMPSTLQEAIGEPIHSNRFRSASERDAYWKSLEGRIPYDEPSDDVFAKAKVVSGGAPGLGRGRR